MASALEPPPSHRRKEYKHGVELQPAQSHEQGEIQLGGTTQEVEVFVGADLVEARANIEEGGLHAGKGAEKG